MRKSLLLGLTLILLMPSHALAESDENVTRRRPDRPAQVEIQEIRQDRREERQENRQEVRSNVAENHANRLEKRFGFYFDRLNAIIARFNTRLNSLNSSDPAVVKIKTKLTLAKTKLLEAKTKGDEAIDAFRSIDPAKFAQQKAAALAARDLANSARKLYMEVHTLLKEAVKELKMVSKPALPAASAAVQNTNN